MKTMKLQIVICIIKNSYSVGPTKPERIDLGILSVGTQRTVVPDTHTSTTNIRFWPNDGACRKLPNQLKIKLQSGFDIPVSAMLLRRLAR